MKKVMVVLFLIITFIFPLKSYATEVEYDTLNDQFPFDGVEELKENLPEEVEDYLEDYNINDPINSVSNFFNAKNIFSILFDFFKNNIKTPLKSGLLILSILLFSSVAENIYKENKLLQYITSLSIAATALIPAISVITSCAEAIKSVGAYMLSFIPIFAVLLVAKGKPLTSAGFSAVMTFAVQAVTNVCTFLLIPLSTIQLSLGLSSSASKDIKILSVSSGIKKVSSWVLMLVCTVFLGVLSVQTAINSPSDNLYTKTAKFVLGSAVPVVGNVVAESLNAVRGSLSIICSSVAVYGIAVVLFIALPVIIQLIIWRLVMLCCSLSAEILSNCNATTLLKTVDQTFAFILGIIVLIIVMLILSVAIVMVI